MILTLSKRFDFCASIRYHRKEWSDKKNHTYFGKKSLGKYGHGHNYIAHFIFTGSVNPQSGMMVNISEIKKTIAPFIENHYDHKFLNLDTPPFNHLLPTPENIAKQLLDHVQEIFVENHSTIIPIACHLIESPQCAATAYQDGTVERHLFTDFSAARRTFSPHLTEEENNKVFGKAASPSGHGHHYRLRLTLGGEIDPLSGMLFRDVESSHILNALQEKIDHKHLNTDLIEFKNRPVTTETLCQILWEELEKKLPIKRLRLHENDHFFIEKSAPKEFAMGISGEFTAAHRLYNKELTDQENFVLYEKCSNPNGHGHLYKVECTFRGDLDPKTGTLYSLDKANRHLADVLGEYDYKHLDLETKDFREMPSSSENIVQFLWGKLKKHFGKNLQRVRLWETQNNRFTLRKLS